MNEYSYLERHMGTDVSLSFVCEEESIANTIAAKTFSTIYDYERRFSRFLPDSELSRLNQNGSLVVSHDFISILNTCIDLYHLTNHTFNPLLQVSTLGYTDTFTSLKNTTPALIPATYDTNLDRILVDQKTRTVTLQPKQQIDFGGILKGYLATKITEDIQKSYPDCAGIIINIGGDIATHGHDALHEPFIFQLYNPVTGEEIPTILTNTALATSGTYVRSWQTSTDGKRHHIVDVASLENPTSGLLSASIVHRDGASAEAVAKLFLVTGVSEALKQMPPEKYHYKYFTVSTDGNIATNLL